MKYAVLISDYGDPSFLNQCTSSIPDSENIYTLVHDANHTGYGFTKAYNHLLLDVVDDEEYYDIFILLNNDTVLHKDFFVELEKAIENHPEVGIFGVKVVSIKDKNTIQHGGTQQAFPAGVHKGGLVSNDDCNEDTYERWVTGCCMAIRRDCLIEIGAMDKRYDLVFSDSDWCYTARARGWKVLYVSQAIVYHHGGVSTGKNADEKMIRRMTHDRLKFNEKWMGTRLFAELDTEVV